MFEPIDLGDRVKDPISGMVGICTCITTWLHGCVRVGLQPETHKDGKPAESIYFDASQLIVVKKRAHEPMVVTVVAAPKAEKRRGPGGPSREGSGFAR